MKLRPLAIGKAEAERHPEEDDPLRPYVFRTSWTLIPFQGLPTVDGGADGFMLLATYTPGCFEEFVDMVVPELQRRGRYRHEYPATTLRDNILMD